MQKYPLLLDKGDICHYSPFTIHHSQFVFIKKATIIGRVIFLNAYNSHGETGLWLSDWNFIPLVDLSSSAVR
jgi:hypothetical protein